MSSNPTVNYEVAARFEGLRKSYLASGVVREIATGLTALSLAWIALSVCDYLWELPLTVRRISALIVLGLLLAYRGHRTMHILSLTKRKPFAALLEGHFAEFGQRLRTVLEVIEGRVRGPHEMLSALGHQTLGRWETVAPGQIVPRRQMYLALATALLATACIAGLWSVGQWRLGMLRALGADRSYTSLEVSPRDARVIEGEPIVVGLELRGRTGREVTLRYRLAETDDGKTDNWTQIDVLREDGPQRLGIATYVAELGKAADALEYQFIASADATPVYRIDVAPLIDAIDIRTIVTPPAYTNLAPREFQTTDVSALRGSELEVTVVTNHPLVKARLLFGPKRSQLESLELSQPMASMQWSFKLPTETSVRWRFEGESEASVPLTPVAGVLRIRDDEPPRVQWLSPADDIQVHTLTELPMEITVSDDYGVVETGIAFTLGDEDEFLLAQWNADEDSADESRVKVKLAEMLPLESFGLTDRDFVAYYAYAIDNREGASRRVESDVRYIDIRPLRQYYSEQEAESLGGGLGRGFFTSVGEIIQRQRFLMNRTRRLARSSSAIGEQLGTLDGLIAAQSELAGFARFLIDRLAALERDDSEALAIAETAMLQAADSLAVGNFQLARTQQEEAMRALMEARISLREITLSQLSAQQRQALNQLLQQLNQKLRRTPAATDRMLADSLQKLAAAQLALGVSVGALVRDRTLGASGGDSAASTVEESEPNDSSANAIATLDERLAGSLEEQSALLARLQDIGDSLSEQILKSDLVTLRLAASLTAMDDLLDRLQAEELDEFESTARDSADKLAELAILIEAARQSEAVERLPSLAELTASLAALERDLSTALQSDAGKSTATSAGGVSHLGNRLLQRSQTVQELLKMSNGASDDFASEVAASLAKFLEASSLA